jgi:hypothetical protein
VPDEEDFNWAAADRRDFIRRHPEPYVDKSDWGDEPKSAPKPKPADKK